MIRRGEVAREAGQQPITRQEGLSLSARDRTVFFDALVHPPKANARLRRAFRMAAKRITVR